jgi:hypothetical protein
MQPQHLVLRFLESLGRPRDVSYYIHLFQQLPQERFALLSLDASSLLLDPHHIALHVQFLHTLGLVPVITTGLLEPYESTHAAHTLHGVLAELGVPSEVMHTSPEKVLHALQQKKVPLVLLPPPELDSSFQHRFQQLASLAWACKSRKVILTRLEGGLHHCNTPVSHVDVSNTAWIEEYPETPLHPLLKAVQDFLLKPQSHPCTVSLVAPAQLLQELFTLKGSGTLFRKGVSVLKHTHLSDVDTRRLSMLLESAFGKPLSKEFLSATTLQSYVYADEDYRTCAILQDTPHGIYLSKFAVTQQAQGEGLGRDIWQSITRDFPSFFWRSRTENSFNPWYMQQCDAMVRTKHWWVFFKGPLPNDVSNTVDYATQLPVDFVSEPA